MGRLDGRETSLRRIPHACSKHVSSRPLYPERSRSACVCSESRASAQVRASFPLLQINISIRDVYVVVLLIYTAARVPACLLANDENDWRRSENKKKTPHAWKLEGATSRRRRKQYNADDCGSEGVINPIRAVHRVSGCSVRENRGVMMNKHGIKKMIEIGFQYKELTDLLNGYIGTNTLYIGVDGVPKLRKIADATDTTVCTSAQFGHTEYYVDFDGAHFYVLRDGERAGVE